MAGVILAAVIAAPAPAGEKSSGEGATLRAREDLCRILGELRGQRFHGDVPVERLTREQSREFLRRKLEQEYPPEAIAAEQAAYRHFGLLQADEDLEALFVELMVERAAGFYDPEVRRLFIVEGQPWARTVLAHELAVDIGHEQFVTELGHGRIAVASPDKESRWRRSPWSAPACLS